MIINLSIDTLVQLAYEMILAILLAILAGPLAILIARKMAIIDIPGSSHHKQHAWPTPLAGGLVLLITVPCLAALFGVAQVPTVSWLLLASFVIFMLGIADDKYGLSAPQKFAGQILATCILIYAGISVKILGNFLFFLPPWLITLLDGALTLFWMVGITNAFNLIDSMDGLVAGLATISSGFFILISLVSGQLVLTETAAIIFGACIGLYLYNITPARFFLGDSGAQTLGFMLGAIGILYTPLDMHQGSTWFMPILLLGVPVFDTTMVVVSRLRRRKSIFQADLAHSYHRLVRLGLAPSQAVLVIQITAFILCNVAFVAMPLPPGIASSIFFAVLLLGVGLIVFFEKAVKIEA